MNYDLKIGEKKTVSYLVFTRYDYGLKKDMKFLHQVYVIKSDQSSFFHFVDILVDISKKDNAFLNVYRLSTFAPYLFKVAWIDKGKLYTL